MQIKHNGYTFTQGEIDQLVSLTLAWANGGIRPIDQRKYSKTVLNYARSNHLVEYHCKHGVIIQGAYYLSDDCPKCRARKTHWRLYPATDKYFTVYLLPVYVLWRLVDPIIGDRTGYSVARDQQWYNLNIYPANIQHHTIADFIEMLRVLATLAQYRFINFHYAGEIWQITRRPESDWILS